MLKRLKVENFALVQDADILFNEGITTLIGDSGSGKSLLVECISFLSGQKVKVDIINKNCNECTVQMLIEIPTNIFTKIISIKNLDKYTDNNIFTMSRTLYRTGRNQYFINNVKANSSVIKFVFNFLFDVHKQFENLLINETTNLVYLDLMANNKKEYNTYYENFINFNNIDSQLCQLQFLSKDQEKINEYKFICKEIEALDLKDNEVSQLLKEHKNLKKITKSIGKLIECKQMFEDSDIIEKIFRAKNLTDVIIDQEHYKLVENSYYDLTEFYDYISYHIDNNLLFQEKLLKIEDRLNDIYKLQDKYGNDLISIKKDMEDKIYKLDNINYEISLLEKKHKLLLQKLQDSSNILTQTRKEVASVLKKRITRNLKKFHIANVEFDIRFKEVGYNNYGKDKIEFYIKTNIDNDFVKIDKLISGGELSRVNLALKILMAEFFSYKTFIFDEIDIGISGKIAFSVAKELKKISYATQIIIVSHIPQIIASGTNILKVEKKVKDNRTCLLFKYLDNEQRVSELAQLLSTDKITSNSKKNAIDLISYFNKN